jgi:uncharacterized protein (DUF433 family)
MIVGVEYPHITVDPANYGGRPAIEGTRISVQIIAEYFNLYGNVERILQALPHLTHAQVHSALAFYYDHKEQMDQDIERSNDTEILKSYGVRIFDEEFEDS